MSDVELRELQLSQLEILKETDKICRENNIKYYMIAGTLLGAVRHKGFIPWDLDIDIAMLRVDYDKFIKCCKKDLSSSYFLQNYQTDIDFYPALSRICKNGTYIDWEHSKHLRCHKGIHIDIFPLDNVPDDQQMRDRQRRQLLLLDNIMVYKAAYIYDKGIFNWKAIIKRSIRFVLAPVSLRFIQGMRERVMTKYSGTETMFVCSTASRYGYDKQVMEKSIYGDPVFLDFEEGFFPAPQMWREYLTKLYGDYMQLPPVEKRLGIEDPLLLEIKLL